jgi:hypothetical protein
MKSQSPGKYYIGAPFSRARYNHAHRICDDCLFYAATAYSGEVPASLFVMIERSEVCTCYVCEKPRFCRAIKPVIEK